MNFLKINEMYPAIQGETSLQGYPCFMVRLTGCNLRCIYCDTDYAYEEGRDCTVKSCVKAALDSGLEYVTVTGGEPMLQKNTIRLIEILLENRLEVGLETNGSLPLDDVPEKTRIIMDVKTPSSGYFNKMNLDNLFVLKPEDEIKFVLVNGEDYKWARSFCEEHNLFGHKRLLFQPAYNMFPPQELSDRILEDKIPVRFQIQLHKYLWGNKRGK